MAAEATVVPQWSMARQARKTKGAEKLDPSLDLKQGNAMSDLSDEGPMTG